MNHIICKNGFHGEIKVTFLGPAQGFKLSHAQVRIWKAARCPVSADCMCRGEYGTGYAEDSALIDYDAASDSFWLIPA